MAAKKTTKKAAPKSKANGLMVGKGKNRIYKWVRESTIDPTKINVAEHVNETDWLLSKGFSDESALCEVQADLEMWLEEIQNLIDEIDGEDVTLGELTWETYYREEKVA